MKETKQLDNTELNDLMFEALDHGFYSVEDGGPIIPFVMTKNINNEKGLQRFVAERIEDGVEKAKEYIEKNRNTIKIYALVFDGYITLEDKKADAILVEAGGIEGEAIVLAQRYELKGFLKKKNYRVGNPALIDKPKSRLVK